MEYSANWYEIKTVIYTTLKRQGIPAPEAKAEAVLLELARHFGGTSFYFPKGARMESILRARKIATAREQGESIQTIARKHGLSQRAILNNLNRARQEGGNTFTCQTEEDPATVYQAEIFLTDA